VLFAGGGTGGHLYPALALAEAMTIVRPGLELHFVGATRGVEARVLPARGVPHTLLPIEPIHRRPFARNWRFLPALARSVAGIAAVFRRFRPELVVGTGGYASGPACLYAVAVRIPMAVQEQNSWPGITTRLLSRWARQVHLGFPEAERRLRPGPRTRVFALGNPVRPPAGLERAMCRARFGLGVDATVMLVVGGSQGARALNDMLAGALERAAARAPAARPTGFEILWATGPTHIDAVNERLRPLGVMGWVHTSGYIDEMPAALAAADFALSRAGAMATAELLAAGIPALLVPLPTAAADHQTHNARALERAGAAICLVESSLTADRLWSEVHALAADRERRQRMTQAALLRAKPYAARDIARELLTLLPAG
jgi:UDP-N-acetylglucosamine--N-acetylmuramyl-(pentapeptide) pyrophosphoryl-undecaprenol N-acetylglucosamine transferase